MASLPLVDQWWWLTSPTAHRLPLVSSATQRLHLAEPTSSHCAAGVSPNLPPVGGTSPLPPPTGGASPLPESCHPQSAPAALRLLLASPATRCLLLTSPSSRRLCLSSPEAPASRLQRLFSSPPGSGASPHQNSRRFGTAAPNRRPSQ